MSPHPPPPARALEAVRGVLRALSGVLQTYRLYPAGHPNRAESVRAIEGPVRALVEATAGSDPPIVTATRNSLYLDAFLLARESISLYRVRDAFEQAGIDAVEFLPGVTSDDLDALAAILVGERPLGTTLDGLTINPPRSHLVSDDEAGELTELLRTYSVGLDVLRQTAERVTDGRDVDIDSTRRVVERMTAQVSGDPAQALLVSAVKSYDEYTYYHMLNVCILSIAMGHAMGLAPDQVATLGVGALLHDVGKLKVPLDVLQHVGALSEEQWRLIQKHPVDGAGLILVTGRNLFDPAVAIVFEHHVGYDLSGYPALSGRPRPSLPARLVAVADCFDAITSKRSYRRAEERRQALSILQAGAGRGFDPVLVRTFVRMLGMFPVGSLVMLDSGEVAMVVRNHERLLARPVVRLVLDATGTPCDPEEIDLSGQRPDGSFLRSVDRSLDPQEVGVDMVSLLVSGQVEPAEEDQHTAALVHEPSPGEPPPPGYVDTHHNGEDADGELLPIDPDVSAPFPR